MICRPTGNPSAVKPIGAAVAGRYDRLASPAKNSCSAYGSDLPLTLTVRSSRWGLRLCGKAAVAQQHIEALEEFLPSVPQFCPRLVGTAPGTVQQCRAARHRSAVAHVIIGKRRSDLLLPGEILVAHA